MFPVESPMEMSSLPSQPHLWQIFLCNWKNTPLQWVSALTKSCPKKNCLFKLMYIYMCIYNLSVLFCCSHVKVCHQITDMPPYYSSQSLVVWVFYCPCSFFFLDSWCSDRLLPQPGWLWGLWSKNVSATVTVLWICFFVFYCISNAVFAQ